MIIKTVDQLTELEKENLNNDDLFEVTHYNNNGTQSTYTSNKIKYQSVHDKIRASIDGFLGSKYALENPAGGKKCITNLQDQITSNRSNITTLNNRVTTVEQSIDQKLQEFPSFIHNTTDPDAWISPMSSTKDNYKTGGTFYRWDFRENTNTRITTEQNITQKGILVCYGWITAPTNLDPATAYVTFEFQRKTDNSWIMAQLQPWVIGSKSSSVQYVGFTIPVSGSSSSPLKTRISSGFNITDYSQSYASRGLILNVNSGTDISETNLTNAFIGYVLT